MIKRIQQFGLALTGGLILSAAGVVHAEAPRDPLSDIVATQLGIEQFEINTLDLPLQLQDNFSSSFTFEGVEFEMNLRAVSLRSDKYEVLVPHGVNGALIPLENVPAPRTYQGSIDSLPGSHVRATLLPNGQLQATMFIADDVVWEILPLTNAVEDANLNRHIVLDWQDVKSLQDTFCGLDLLDQDHETDHVQNNGGGGGQFDALKFCEIAFDTDYEFFQKNNSNVNTTINDIENVMNVVDGIYRNDVEIGYDITTIIVRSTSNDPYTSSNAQTMLGEFLNHWVSQQSGVQRDIAHMFTGKNTGGTIGIAYLRAICSKSIGYGLSQSRYTSVMRNRAGLTCHELGHNWAAGHCDGNGDCRIMCSIIAQCNGDVTRFGQSSKNVITSYKNSRSCLSNSLPFRMTVSPPPPINAGNNYTWSVENGVPSNRIALFYSLKGSGNTEVAPGIFIELKSPKMIPPIGIMDGNGDESWNVFIPNGAAGIRLFTQAVDEDGNLVDIRFDDIQ